MAGIVVGALLRPTFDILSGGSSDPEEPVVCCIADISELESLLSDTLSGEGALLDPALARELSLDRQTEEKRRLDLEVQFNNETRNSKDLADNTAFNFNLTNLRNYLCYAEELGPSKFTPKTPGEVFNFENMGISVYLGAEDVGGFTRTKVFLVPTYFYGDVDNEGKRIYEDIRGIQVCNYGHSRRPPDPYQN